MTISPDTDAIYQEAIGLQKRVEEYEAKHLQFQRLLRDRELELLQDGFMPDADPKIRLYAARLRANQMLQDSHGDLFKFIDEEGAAIAAVRVRNEGVVAAGWAENFAYTSQTRRIASQFEPTKGEIES